MATDVDTNITLTASGGETAAAEISKAAKAMENMGASNERLKESFQHKFQHIGLQLFAGDLLRAAGLGREAREVIGLLNMAMTSLGGGGIALAGAGLAALTGVIATVIEHQRTLIESSKKLIEEDDKHLKLLNDKIGELEKYATATGHLNKVQRDYLEILRETAREEAAKKNSDIQTQIAQLNELIAKEKDRVAALEESDKAVQAYAMHSSGAYPTSAAAIDGAKKKIQDFTLQLRQAETEMNALHRTGTKTFSDMAAEAQKSANTTYLRFHTADDAIIEGAKKVAESNQKLHEQIDKDTEKMEKQAIQTIDKIGGSFFTGFGQMIVDGKSFTETMTEAFKSMAKQIISDIIRIATEWAILTSMGFPVGGFGGFAAKAFGGGMATGGDVMVDKPTLFLAGEAGPERATFTPLANMGRSAAAGGGSGGGVTIGTVGVSVTVNGVSDPNKIADQVGLKIIERIRGAGQLGFVRS